jgi:hypothetical protein
MSSNQGKEVIRNQDFGFMKFKSILNQSRDFRSQRLMFQDFKVPGFYLFKVSSKQVFKVSMFQYW